MLLDATLYRFFVGSILYLKLVIRVQFYSASCSCYTCHFNTCLCSYFGS